MGLKRISISSFHARVWFFCTAQPVSATQPIVGTCCIPNRTAKAEKYLLNIQVHAKHQSFQNCVGERKQKCARMMTKTRVHGEEEKETDGEEVIAPNAAKPGPSTNLGMRVMQEEEGEEGVANEDNANQTDRRRQHSPGGGT